MEMKTIGKIIFDVQSGDVLVGSAGGHSLIVDVEHSSAMPGLMRVETEHGHLYMDPESEVEVLA